MAWLKGGFNLPVPEKIIPIVAEGKIQRAKNDLQVQLDVAGQAGFSMALSATIRRQEEDWIVAVAPGTLKLPERSVTYEAFVFSIARGKASLRDVRLTCAEQELATRINGSATWDDKQLKVTFRMLDTKVKDKAIDNLVARLEVDWTTGDVVPDLRWGKLDGDHLHVNGRWGKELDLTVTLRAGDLKRPLVRDLVHLDLEGAVAIDAHVTGTREEPQVTGILNLMKISAAGMPPLSLVIPIQSSKNAVRLWSVAEKTPYGSLTIDGTVQLTGDAPMDLGVRLTTDDLSPLLDRLAPQTRKWIPRGGLAAEVSLRGPALKPKLEGRAEFVALRWRPPPPLAEALDIRVGLRLDEDGIQIDIADGLLGQGPFWASGRFDVFRPNTPLSLWITASDALAVEDPLARLRVKPDVVLVWEAGRILKLSGRVEIPLAIYHREFGAATPGARPAREVAPPRLRLIPGETGGFIIPGIPGLEQLDIDLTFVTTGEFRIENGSIGVLAHAEGQLTGTAAEPALSGVARSIPNRGEVKLAPGNFLHIDTMEVVFPGDLGRVPTVRFQGHVGAGEGMIQVLVDGPLESPSLVLRSEPPMPQKDLLARLAFGHISGAVSGETGVATLALYMYDQTKDAWPSADRREGFFDRIRPTVVPGDTSLQRRVPWELPPQGMVRSTSLRTEYVLNSVFSVVAETNREGDVGGDLKIRIRF
jgi:translocation and assembly module TamB